MIVILHAISNDKKYFFKKTKFTAELQLLMCIQNAHGCVILISIAGEIVLILIF